MSALSNEANKFVPKTPAAPMHLNLVWVLGYLEQLRRLKKSSHFNFKVNVLCSPGIKEHVELTPSSHVLSTARCEVGQNTHLPPRKMQGDGCFDTQHFSISKHLTKTSASGRIAGG